MQDPFLLASKAGCDSLYMSDISKKQIDILFIIPPYHHRNGSSTLFPLGIGSIISCVEKEKYTYDYIDCTSIIKILRNEELEKLQAVLKSKLSAYQPLLVGIGPCVTPAAKGIEVIVRCCLEIFGRESVLAGGPFTMLPSQEWFFYQKLGLKYLVKGDGEIAVCAAIQTKKSGNSLSFCPSISRKGYSYINSIPNLDALPFPKRIQLEENLISERRRLEKEGKSAHIVTSRGCPYSCNYCVSGNLGIKFRKRTSPSIVAEMCFLQHAFQVTDIIFYDDCFFTTPASVHQEINNFCGEIKAAKLQITWQIEMRPDILMCLSDEEIMVLSDCGCRQINVGVEKTAPIGASIFGKKFDYEALKRYIYHMHKICPIKIAGTFILGGKDETEDSVRTLIQNSLRLGLDKAAYSPLFVYPDTPIYHEVFSDSYSWLDIINHEDEAWGEVVYESRELDKNNLIGLIDEAYKSFYADTEYSDSERVKDRYNLKG